MSNISKYTVNTQYYLGFDISQQSIKWRRKKSVCFVGLGWASLLFILLLFLLLYFVFLFDMYEFIHLNYLLPTNTYYILTECILLLIICVYISTNQNANHI